MIEEWKRYGRGEYFGLCSFFKGKVFCNSSKKCTRPCYNPEISENNSDWLESKDLEAFN